MRTPGRSGATPADDDVARILEAAKRGIAKHGKDFGISDVAKDVGATHQTSAFSAGVNSDVALLFGRSLLERFSVDWTGVAIEDDASDRGRVLMPVVSGGRCPTRQSARRAT